MEKNISEMETRKAIRISLTILAPILLLVYWKPILEITIAGGTAFGLVFLMVKHHRKLLGLVHKTREWLSQHTN